MKILIGACCLKHVSYKICTNQNFHICRSTKVLLQGKKPEKNWSLDSELHGTQQDQRGPIESELNECGHKGRVLAPVIGRYGGASSDLSLILDLVARELARKHTAFYNTGFSEAKAMFKQKLARKWGHAIARGWATLLLDRLRDIVVANSNSN